MALTNVPVFAQTPKNATAVVTTAITAMSSDTPTPAGAAVLLYTAGANGALVTRLVAMPRATVVASSLVLFEMPQGSSNYRLKDSVLMAGYTASTSTAIPQTVFANYSEARPMRLAAGESLYVGSQNAINIVFCAEITEF